MAKKSRRARKRKARAVRLSPAQMVQPLPAEEISPRPAREIRPGSVVLPTRRATPKEQPDLAEEYRYVVSDLRRIAVLAGVMLAILVVLALVLR